MDASTPLEQDMSFDCVRCGYSLEGLDHSGRCPECGTPIGLSTRGRLLQYADPDWVESVARGLNIILWMMVLGVAIGIVVGVASGGNQAVILSLQLVTAAVGFYGVWLLTTPDPSEVAQTDEVTARKVVRICLVVGMAGMLVQIVGYTHIVFIVFSVVLGLVGVVGEFAKFIYFEKIARRIPDDRLAARAVFLRWAYSIAMVGATLIGAMTLFTMRAAAGGPPAAGPGGAGMSIACFSGVVGLAVLVISIMAFIFLLRLRRAVAAEARLARASWRA